MPGILDNAKVQAGSLVAASLETAGMRIQSRMLDLVNGVDGQQLAGLLFLFAIATAIITLAVGGNYKWGRYLLVGPPLFFFCTTVRVQTDGTKWQFGNAAFPPNLIATALRGVMDFAGAGGGNSNVASFFQLWNLFMTDVTQTLVKLPNLTSDNSHMNFITKVEKYMTFWDFNYINDENIRSLIRLTMISECADFYQMRRIIADPHTSDPARNYYREEVRRRTPVVVAAFSRNRDNRQNAVISNLIERGIINNNETLTCNRLWEAVVTELRKTVEKNIKEELTFRLADGENGAATVATFIRKIYTETSRATSMTRLHIIRAADGSESIDWNAVLNDPEFQSGLLLAIDWVIARSLWNEIWDRNPYADSFNFERHPGNRATGMGSETLISDQVATTGSAVAQFNRTEMYQFKGDFVNAALSMPHFQGVLLMLLAASYPFFAMAMVLPGRSGAMLLWMGLWAWAKLWDFGFAVVMMIDNMLYAMFPRGPNLTGNDVMDPGLAWVRIMEIDPNYSSATYYNLIATCLFAVPLVMGVLVKKGGSELINAVHGGWQTYSNRLGGSAVAFARSLQAQSYARRFEAERFAVGVKAVKALDGTKEMKALKAERAALAEYKGALNSEALGGAAAQLNGNLAPFGKLGLDVRMAAVDERMAMIDRQIDANQREAGQQASYNYSAGREGSWASESAVAARYYQHSFLAQHPGKEILNAEASKVYYNPENIIKAGVDNEGTVETINKVLRGGFAPGK